MKHIVSLLLATVLCIMMIACGSEKKSGSEQLTGDISIDGSSTVYPITEAIAEEYRTEQRDVRVTVGVSGTGGGFKKFMRGETDINDASRPIKEGEKRLLEENNINYVELTVAYDGLAVLVHPENNWVDHITVEELKKIWEPAAQGKITKWNQIRPEWPNEEFHLYGPGVASGTYDYFTEAVVGESGSSRGDYTASEDDNVLVQGISTDKNALGFFGLAYYEENVDKLRLVPVDNGSGPVEPTTETVKNNTYAPLSRPVFIYVSAMAAKKPAVADFVKFYLNNAADLVADVGYIPLPKEEYEKEMEKFEKLLPSEVQTSEK